MSEIDIRLEEVFQLGSDRKNEVITALNNAGIIVDEDADWSDIILIIKTYKGIAVNILTEVYPNDTLSLTGGYSGPLSSHNSAWDGSKLSGTTRSINSIDFTNIKELTITHNLYKYASSTTLTANSKVGLTDSSGTWIKSKSRSISTEQNTSYTETFDTSDLTGSYYITFYYYRCNRTSGGISRIYISV